MARSTCPSFQISNGPTYFIRLLGQGMPPGLHFSYHTFNFGPSFIVRAGMPDKSIKTSHLLLTNRDRKEIR